MSSRSEEVSLLLEQHRQGQPEAFEKLLAVVYDELRRLAAYQLQAERPHHTLQPTALVHEASADGRDGPSFIVYSSSLVLVRQIICNPTVA